MRRWSFYFASSAPFIATQLGAHVRTALTPADPMAINNCLDPNADTDCPTPSPTPTPATGLGYPDCTGDMSDLQNGYCDWDLNNEECGEL